MKSTKNRNPKEVRIVTREEEARIVDLLRSPGHSGKSYYADVADLVEVLADTGMRVGESLELRPEDISLERSFITVRVTKGSPRRVPMTKRVTSILKRRQEAGQDRLFSLKDMQIRMAWSWVREAIGLKEDKHFVLHALRYTCAHRLLNAGVSVDIIQAWLGYRDSRSRRLAPLPLEALNHAAELLETYCSNPSD